MLVDLRRLDDAFQGNSNPRRFACGVTGRHVKAAHRGSAPPAIRKTPPRIRGSRNNRMALPGLPARQPPRKDLTMSCKTRNQMTPSPSLLCVQPLGEEGIARNGWAALAKVLIV
jgi:hypothetical protein